MESPLSLMEDFIPAQVDVLSALQFGAIFFVAILALGFVVKLILGKGSDLNHAISSVMAILCIYAVTIVIYTFNPRDLSRYLSPLPFVTFTGEYIMITPITAEFAPLVSGQVLSVVILAFLVNLIDTFFPSGRSLLGWYLWKAAAVLAAMALHYGVLLMMNTFLPGAAVTYAPVILLVILVATLLIGLLNPILTAVLSIFSPLVGALYHFFFATFIGKQLSKAVLTTAILCVLVYLLEAAGYTVICISAAALGAYIPLIAALLILWYLIGHIL